MLHIPWIIFNIFLLTYKLIAKSISVLQLRCGDYEAVNKCKQNSPEIRRIFELRIPT